MHTNDQFAAGAALKGSHVLVTGGSGFLGTHLVQKLKECGAGRITIVGRSDIGRESSSDIAWVHCDLSRPESIAIVRDIGDVDYVFNLAGLTEQQMPHPNPQALWEANVVTLVNLTAALDWSKVVAGIHMGTVAEYGNQKPPFYEHQQLRPSNVYGWSKATSTQYAEMMTAQGYAKWCVARLFMGYGPGQKKGFIVNLVRALTRGESFELNAPTVTRDPVFVDDVVEGLIRLALCPKAIGETVNLCRGKEITLGEIASLGRAIAKSGDIVLASGGSRKGDFLRSCGSTEKLERLTGWKPGITMEEGLQRTISATVA